MGYIIGGLIHQAQLPNKLGNYIAKMQNEEGLYILSYPA